MKNTLKNALDTTLRILAGLTALVLFLPVLVIALLHDFIHIGVAGVIYVFAFACAKAADKELPRFTKVLYEMNIKE